MNKSDWNLLKGRFCQIFTDAKHAKWDNASHLFYDNKLAFGYNMQKLIGLDSPIAKLTATHNNGDDAKTQLEKIQWINSGVVFSCWGLIDVNI